MRRMVQLWVFLTLLMGPFLGCERRESAHSHEKDDDHDHPAAASAAPSNRIDVPASVRENLGITFAKVERRRVASTIRVPGRFELLPSARREYRATLPGWVRVLVKQYAPIETGATVFELDSPEWHKLRKQLHESQAAIQRTTAEVAVAESLKAEGEAQLRALEQRVAALAGAEVRRAELEGELSKARTALPRLDAEIQVKRAALNEARHDFALEIQTAASLLGVTAGHLMEAVPGSPAHGDTDAGGETRHDHEHKVQRWYTIDRLRPTAVAAGVVESLGATDGAWVEANAVVATVIDPNAVRFRATGLQSDLGRLRDGLSATVVPPEGSGIDRAEVLPGTLKVGLVGDPDQRTIDLLVTPQKTVAWSKPGVSALLEISAEGSDGEELAIPAAALVRDELEMIFFRRDPANPDKVMRVVADAGVSDGKWVVVKSGIKAGDEVVLEGAYELKLAGGGKSAEGGHFHADGTWHADDKK